MRTRYFLSLFAILLYALTALAQTDRGTITGRVIDTAGGVVPEAKVTATNLDTGVVYRGASNDLGIYTILYLPVGSYAVEVQRDAFNTYQQQGVTVSISQVVRLDVTLDVGKVASSVTVNADATPLSTEKATMETTFKSGDLEVLPLSVAGGRDVQNHAQTVPMVWGTGFNTSVAGSLVYSMVTVVDGTESTGQKSGGQRSPGMEAVQQFEVQTTGQGADAEGTGGGVIMYTLKSGTNQFHGSGYGFLGNEAFDANTWDNNYFGVKRPRDRYNDYGFSAGGPVYIPKIYDGRNKTFIFGSYERYNQNDLRFAANNNTTPTADFLAGNFSAILGAPILDANNSPMYVKNNNGDTVALRQGMIFDPATQNVFPGNIIPADRISAQTRKLLGFYSQYAPTNSNLVNNYPSPVNGRPLDKQIRYDFKFDENFSEKNHLSVSTNRWFNPGLIYNGPTLWKAGSSNPGIFCYCNDYTQIDFEDRVIDTHIITPNLLNTATFTWNLHHGTGPKGAWNDSSATVDSKALGFPTSGTFAHVSLPLITFGCVNTFEQICEDIIGSHQGSGDGGGDQWHFRDDVSWIKGRHTLKFGAEISALRMNQSASSGGLQYNYSSATGIPSTLYNNAQVSQHLGFGFANFLLGDPASASQGQAPSQHAGRTLLNASVSDSIKVTPKLTLNAGVRYDFTGRFREKHGYWTNFNLNGSNPTWAPLSGAYEYATSGADSWERNEDYKQFAPYIGAAYKVSDKLVARASWGMHFIPIGLNTYSTTPYGANQGYVPSSYTSAGPTAVAFNWDTTIYGGTIHPPQRDPTANQVYGYGTVSIDPNVLHLGRTENWNAGVQYEISPNTVLEVSYVGNIGRDLHEASSNPLNYPTLSSFLPLLQSGKAGAFIDTQAKATAAGVPWYPFLTTTTGGNGGYAAVNAISPYPQISATGSPILFAGSPIGSSAYRALVIELKKRGSNGLTADLNYTLQKVTGNVVNSPNVGGGNFYEGWNNSSQWQDPYAYKSYADTLLPYPRHTLKGYVVYELPFGTGKRLLTHAHALNYLVGGWQLGAMTSYLSGLPLKAVVPSFYNYPGWSAVYANRVGSVANTFKTLDLANPGDPSNLMFNPSAFADPTYGSFGNQQVYSNSFRGWANFNEDFSILKNFYVGHENRVKVVLRGEFFNVFNRHHWSDPNTYSIATPYFGAVTGVSGNRHGQVGARVEW